LGFEVMRYGVDAAFLSAGGYHHHIGLNTWHSAGGTPPPEGHTGLFHIAILYPNQRELAKAVKRVLDHGHAFTGGQQIPAGELYTSTIRTATGWSSTTMVLASNGPTRKASRSSTKTFLRSWIRKTCLKSRAPPEAPGLPRTHLLRRWVNKIEVAR
jgi:hypothetical protein